MGECRAQTIPVYIDRIYVDRQTGFAASHAEMMLYHWPASRPFPSYRSTRCGWREDGDQYRYQLETATLLDSILPDSHLAMAKGPERYADYKQWEAALTLWLLEHIDYAYEGSYIEQGDYLVARDLWITVDRKLADHILERVDAGKDAKTEALRIASRITV